MSGDDSEDDPSAMRKTLRTVTPASRGHRSVEMDAIGWAIFAGIVVVALPLLPILVVVWLLTRLFGRAADRTGE